MSSEAFASAGDVVLAAWESNGQVYFADLNRKAESELKPIAVGNGVGQKHPSLAINTKRQTLLV